MSTKSPTFDAFRLARDRGRLNGKVAVGELPRLADSVMSSDAQLDYAIEGRIGDDGHPGALMKLDARLLLRCERCSEPVEFVLDRTVPFRFVESEDRLNAIPIEDDELEVVVGSHAMALLPWIEDEAILSLPLLPRHAHCSLPLEPSPAAAEVERDNPFAVLAGLRKGGPNGPGEH